MVTTSPRSSCRRPCRSRSPHTAPSGRRACGNLLACLRCRLRLPQSLRWYSINPVLAFRPKLGKFKKTRATGVTDTRSLPESSRLLLATWGSVRAMACWCPPRLLHRYSFAGSLLFAPPIDVVSEQQVSFHFDAGLRHAPVREAISRPFARLCPVGTSFPINLDGRWPRTPLLRGTVMRTLRPKHHRVKVKPICSQPNASELKSIA
jgi:hypothetical protein